MRKAALDKFLSFTKGFESAVLYPYLDVKGLVTIGYGNLIDDLGDIIYLDFTRLSTGLHATQAEIIAAWRLVKSRKDLALGGGGEFEHVTDLRITEESLANLEQNKIRSTEMTLRTYHPAWNDFPADGHLLSMSMGWAMGAHFPLKFPHFTAAVNAGRWEDVATPHGSPASCQMSEVGQNPSFHRRNQANLVLATNAAYVVKNGLDPEVLQYPADLGGA